MSEMQLYNDKGHRLYLTAEERETFAAAAISHSQHDQARTFARTLYYTGCRVSEALELTSSRVDAANGQLVFRTLKKRKKQGEQKQHWRAVPVPPSFLDELNLVHRLKQQKNDVRLWPVSRQTGWNWCKQIMKASNIEGAQATAKGLRHGFGVAAVLKGIPLPTLQKWLGHSDIKTTAHYLQIVGEEEKELAARMWM